MAVSSTAIAHPITTCIYSYFHKLKYTSIEVVELRDEHYLILKGSIYQFDLVVRWLVGYLVSRFILIIRTVLVITENTRDFSKMVNDKRLKIKPLH